MLMHWDALLCIDFVLYCNSHSKSFIKTSVLKILEGSLKFFQILDTK